MEMLRDGDANSPVIVILAHGAGAPMDSPFMEWMARGLSARGLDVVRFEFPYMAARRSGTRRPPDREATLRGVWNGVIAEVRDHRPLVIGGKSMGGRIASLIAGEANADGLLCLGYPFHPPGKPASLRTSHLETLKTKTLIIQGTRDALGSADEVAGYALSPSIEVHWIEDGDHSLKPRKSSGRTLEQNMEEAIDQAARFAAACS